MKQSHFIIIAIVALAVIAILYVQNQQLTKSLQSSVCPNIYLQSNHYHITQVTNRVDNTKKNTTTITGNSNIAISDVKASEINA
jgi:hypothetical protein